MSDPRLLSAEKLEIALSYASNPPWSAQWIRRHIAALTEQLATLRTDAAKLGHEPGCDSNHPVCAQCEHAAWQVSSGEWRCLLGVCGAVTATYPSCNCAQSRIQEGKDA